MAKQQKGTTFVQYSNGVLESVKLLGITWCRCQPYKTGKLGGWILENYMAGARLMNWFYSEIDNIASDLFYEEPSKPLNIWTNLENSLWLKVRGFDASDLSASSLKDRVSECMNATGGPPSVPKALGGCSANVTALTTALLAMVSRLMTRTITDMHIEDIARRIKLFLVHMKSLIWLTMKTVMHPIG